MMHRVQDNRISILVADDHPLFRKALCDILKKKRDFTVVSDVDNGEDAVRQAVTLLPNIVIMDISMPKLSGLEATRQIKSQCPNIAILVLTVHNDIEHIMTILEAGAAGYLTKSVSQREVIAAIRSIMAGETVFATPIFQEILRYTLQYYKKPIVINTSVKLNVREQEVFRLVARGLSNKDISYKLNLSLPTVKSNIMGIFSKLNVSSRTEAVIKGLRVGLISPADIE